MLLYIISNHVAYVLAAVAVYFGVDKILKTLHQDICANYPTQVAIVKLVLAVICIIGAALMLIYLIRKLIARKALSMSSMIKVPSASPLFLVLFSFGYTFSNVYSFYPLFGFIAALVAQQLPFGLVFMWLFVFCMFSSLPKVLVYVLLTYVKGRFVQKFLDVLTKIMTAVCFYAIPILLIVAAWWLIETGLPVLA